MLVAGGGSLDNAASGRWSGAGFCGGAGAAPASKRQAIGCADEAMNVANRAVFLSALLLAAPLAISAQTVTRGAIQISQPWSRPTTTATPAVGYLTIANRGKTPDKLVGATSSLVNRIELHQTIMTGNIMHMDEVPGGLGIAPGQTVTLAPRGYHLMMIGPKRAFGLGAHIPVTLRFQHTGSIDVDFVVRGSPPAASPSMKGMPGM